MFRIILVAAGILVGAAAVLFTPLPVGGGARPQAGPTPRMSTAVTPIPEPSAAPRSVEPESGADSATAQEFAETDAEDGAPEAADTAGDPTGDWPTDEDRGPPLVEAATAEDVSAVLTAEQVTAAFARPPLSEQSTWWPNVRRFLSSQGAIDYESVDPQEVGHTTVIGSGRLIHVAGHLPMAGVDVPTDGGTYRVLLAPDLNKPSGWAVTSIRPLEDLP